MFKKMILALLPIVIAAPVIASNPYNCDSDQTYFFVSTKTDANGNWCIWRVRTGVTTPVGDYKPAVAVLHPIKFQLDRDVEFNVDNCSPTSYSATKMQFDAVLSCSYIAKGAPTRPQMMYYPPNSQYKLQEYKSGNWIDSQSCSQPSNCRIAPVV